MKEYIASHFKIICRCQAHVSVRTKEREKKVSCWQCNRTIKVVMGYGPKNFRCSIIEADGTNEQTVRPIHVDQGGRE